MFRGLFKAVVTCYILCSSDVVATKKNIFREVPSSPFVSVFPVRSVF